MEMFESRKSGVIADCFDNRYEKIGVSDNGFCGFNSLALSLTGNECNFELLLEDCINVFECLPE
jgi:hypothetical protein